MTDNTRPERTYKTAVVGAAGYWGSYYTKAYAAHPACDLYAIADTAVDRRRLFAERYDIPSVYDTTEDLLKNDPPDICTISLPVSESYKAVLACAEAGVPVITCEKPIAESLAKADWMIERCRELGASLSCGTAIWEFPLITQTAEWIAEGNIGDLKCAHLPDGLSPQVSGNGCVILVALLKIVGSEVAWVEGWTDPANSALTDEDCNAYGRIGFENGIVCDVPSMTVAARERRGCMGVSGEHGRVWISRQGPVFLRGKGEDQYPVFPPFWGELKAEKADQFLRIVGSFVALSEKRGAQRGAQRSGKCGGQYVVADCDAHGYRQALEIAIALKLSARDGHKQVGLPLTDRSNFLNPVPYRMLGGDVTGWDAIGLREPVLRD
jgi:hypothetical protein